MLLREQFITQGNDLFRKRSFWMILPGIILLSLAYYQYHCPANSQVFKAVWELFCFCVSLVGLAGRAYTIGCTPKRTSGRNTRKGQVAEALNTTGMYSVTRNPLYLANFVVALGAMMFFFMWWLIFIYIFIFWLFYERVIFAEEEFLRNKFGEPYLQWAETTPVFFPVLKNWRSPELSFSWRIAVKGEYQTISLTILVSTMLHVLTNLRLTHHIELGSGWAVLMGMTLLFFVLVRFLRKRTAFFYVADR